MNFAEINVSYPDGQQGVGKPPSAIIQNGFIPATALSRGQPLPAQWINWLLNNLYRHINRDKVSNAAGAGLFTVPDSFIRLEAFDRADPNKFLVAIGYKGTLATVHTLKIVQSATLTLGTATASGDQPILGGSSVIISASSRNFGEL